MGELCFNIIFYFKYKYNIIGKKGGLTTTEGSSYGLSYKLISIFNPDLSSNQSLKTGCQLSPNNAVNLSDNHSDISKTFL